jgi:three-Cys-motif partner protein
MYSAGEMGSPLIAIETLLDHQAWPRLSGTEFVFLFCEPISDRYKALCERVAEFGASRGGLPSNVKVQVDQITFADRATLLTDTLAEQKKRLAPTFAFVDPFGFSGVPLELVRRLLSFDKCEVFFNFMYDFINRFATAGNVDAHLEDIFGTTEYLNVANYTNSDHRRDFLLGLYKRQLQKVAGFPYVQRFDMINRGGHITYSLFHGTRNLAGLKLMKSAMWSVDPISGSRFSDRDADAPTLSLSPDLVPLRKAILSNFAGTVATVEEVEAFTLTETIYSASHYNRLVLAPLEREKIIEVVSTTRTKRATFPPGTRILFPD